MGRPARKFTGVEIELVELLWEDMFPHCTERYISKVLKCGHDRAASLVRALGLKRQKPGRRAGPQPQINYTGQEQADLSKLSQILGGEGVEVLRIEGPNVILRAASWRTVRELIERLDIPFDDDPDSLYSSVWRVSADVSVSEGLSSAPVQIVAPYEPILVSLAGR